MGFNQPAQPGDKLELDALAGRLLLVYPKEHTTKTTEAFGEKDVLIADIVVLDGNNAGEELRDAYIFPGVMIGQLKGYIGNPDPALGRLSKGQPKPGKQAPWILADFTDYDADIATAWVNSHPRGFHRPQQQQPAPAQTHYTPQQDPVYTQQQPSQQDAAAAQALEQQRAAAALQSQFTQAQPAAAQQQPAPGGGIVNTATGEITNSGGAVNFDTVRTLLGLAVPDPQITAATGATQEQINAIRNLPAN
jgi:hypothetical protein